MSAVNNTVVELSAEVTGTGNAVNNTLVESSAEATGAANATTLTSTQTDNLNSIILIVFVSSPHAWKKLLALRRAYAPHFLSVEFVADSNFCQNRGGHRACRGPPTRQNPLAIAELSRLEHQWVGADLFLGQDLRLSFVEAGGGWLQYNAHTHIMRRVLKDPAMAKQLSGFLLVSDDTIVNVELLQGLSLNASQFWVPLLMGSLEHIGLQHCVIRSSKGYSTCSGDAAAFGEFRFMHGPGDKFFALLNQSSYQVQWEHNILANKNVFAIEKSGTQLFIQSRNVDVL